MGVKNYLLILIILLPLMVMGQTNQFEYTQHDTLYSGDSAAVALHGDIQNLTASELSLTIIPIEITKPTDWRAYYCILPLVCLPMEFVPSYTFTLGANESVMFSFDIQTFNAPGEGEWKILAVDSSSMEVDSAFVRMEYLTLDIDDGFTVPENFLIANIYPNPVNAQVNVDLNIEETGNYKVQLISLTGRSVLERVYSLSPGMNHFSWNLQGLNSGNYFLTVENGGLTHTRKLIIIK